MTQQTAVHQQLVESVAEQIKLLKPDNKPVAIWLYFDINGVAGYGGKLDYDQITFGRLGTNPITWQYHGQQRAIWEAEVTACRPRIRPSANVYRLDYSGRWKFSHSS